MALMSSSSSSPAVDRGDSVWSDIDLAERHLVSSQFDKAAALSTEILKRLIYSDSNHAVLDNEIEANEIDDILESAGMVFIQAYNEADRANKIFQDLEVVFGSLVMIPSSVFFYGVGLQLSRGHYADAQIALESYLQQWTCSSESENFRVLKSASSADLCTFHLKLETYVELLEIYCIHVLAKGLKSVDLAVCCAKEAAIPASKKQAILDKIEKLTDKGERENRGLIPSKLAGAADCDVTLPMSPMSQLSDQIYEERKKTHASKVVDAHFSLRSFHLISPVMGLLSSCVTVDSVNHSLHVSRWHKLIQHLSRQKAAVGGAVTFFLMFAIYKQRLKLHRIFQKFGLAFRNLSLAIRLGLIDFWNLAFNVQLNPLAAVQPLPSSQGLRR